MGSPCRCRAPGQAVRGAGRAASCAWRVEEGTGGLSAPALHSASGLQGWAAWLPASEIRRLLHISLLSPHLRSPQGHGNIPSPQGRRKDCGHFVQTAELAPGPREPSELLAPSLGRWACHAGGHTHRARTLTRAHAHSAPRPSPTPPGARHQAQPRSPGLGHSTCSTVRGPGAGGLFPRSGAGLGTCKPDHRLLSSSGPQESPQMPQAPQQWPRVFS